MVPLALSLVAVVVNLVPVDSAPIHVALSAFLWNLSVKARECRVKMRCVVGACVVLWFVVVIFVYLEVHRLLREMTACASVMACREARVEVNPDQADDCRPLEAVDLIAAVAVEIAVMVAVVETAVKVGFLVLAPQDRIVQEVHLGPVDREAAVVARAVDLTVVNEDSCNVPVICRFQVAVQEVNRRVEPGTIIYLLT